MYQTDIDPNEQELVQKSATVSLSGINFLVYK